jgi:hypothetical protein
MVVVLDDPSLLITMVCDVFSLELLAAFEYFKLACRERFPYIVDTRLNGIISNVNSKSVITIESSGVAYHLLDLYPLRRDQWR